MKSARKQQKPRTTGAEFDVKIEDDTELGLATLIVESEESQYQPIAVVASINEARELAKNDLRMRVEEIERDGDPGLCPHYYKVWAQHVAGRRLQGLYGSYCVVAEFLATDL